MFSQLMVLKRLDDGTLEANPSPDKGERVYGGQFLAQCLGAAVASTEDGRRVHSLHAYFLRPGDVDRPVRLSLDRVRDGRGFSSRAVAAWQGGKELFRMLVSLQVPVTGPRYERARMPEVPPPEAVTFTYDDFNARVTGETEWHGADRPMDIRYVNPPGERGEAVTEPQLMWMRIRERLADDAGLHQAGIAYLSDSALVDHVMLPHGLRWQDPDFAGASLDHAMWFHRPARADEWLLFEQTVEATGAGRGLSRGSFFDRAGNLVATCMQEGLMRWLDA